jgi:beta-lactamase class A
MKTRSLLLSMFVLVTGCAESPSEPVAGSVAELTEGHEAVVGTTALNLRAGPGTEHAILAVMRQGDRVRVRASGSENGFAPVTFEGIDGWAFEELLTVVGEAGPPPAPGSLADAVAALVREIPGRSPGTELGILVQNLSTGELAGSGEDVRHVSASSAKAMWVAAAMRAGAGVGDIAGPIFGSSDNVLSGTAIDRAGGIDAVNETYWNVFGMSTSIVANWSFGRPRHATHQGVMGGDNYFTARDVVTFLARLDSGELLGERTDELRTYMTWSPRSGWGGWMGTLLPEDARASMMHKAGWLPPPDYAEYSTLNDVGIVQVPGGQRYAIALLARHGASYGAQAAFVERASCVVYRAISGASIGCRD